MNPSSSTSTRSGPQRAGVVLTWLVAVSALVAAVSAIPDVTRAGDATLVVQTWRMYGLFLCCGLFVLLAMRPDAHGPVWALVIGNKAALTVTAAIYLGHGGIAEAAKTAGWDGGLTAALVVAYLLSRS